MFPVDIAERSSSSVHLRVGKHSERCKTALLYVSLYENRVRSMIALLPPFFSGSKRLSYLEMRILRICFYQERGIEGKRETTTPFSTSKRRLFSVCLAFSKNEPTPWWGGGKF